MTSEQSSRRSMRMWSKIGGVVERYAYEQAEKGYCRYACALAQFAEACFWQSTGEGDFTSIDQLLKDLTPLQEGDAQ